MLVTLQGDVLLVTTTDKTDLPIAQSLPARRWDGGASVWRAPYVRENYEYLQRMNVPLGDIAPPLVSGYTVDKPEPDSKFLVVKTLASPQDIALCRKIPEYRSFSAKHGGWLCRITQLNVKYLLGAFPQATWGPLTQQYVKQWAKEAPRQSASSYNHLLGRARQEVDMAQPLGIKLAFTPYYHQEKAIRLCMDEPYFALFMQQRTGKSPVALAKAQRHYQQGQINGLLIICPAGVKDVWAEMLDTFLPADMPKDVFVWEAKTRHKAKDWILRESRGAPLRVFIINCDALSSKLGTSMIELFVAKHTCLGVVDESSRFKTPSSKRTRNLLRLRKLIPYRLIMTGTPVTQGPLDLYSQLKFLDETVLGFSSYYACRDRYAILGGFQNRNIVSYVRLDELVEKVDKVAFRVTLAECMDLPTSIYQRRVVTLSAKERELYNQMRDELKSQVGEHTNMVQFAITQFQALQRISGGFVPLQRLDEDDETERFLHQIEPTPSKLAELLELVDELPTERFVIWCRFRAEIKLIAERLRKEYGPDTVSEFHGGNVPTRTADRLAFQADKSKRRFMISQPQAGGMGQDFSMADISGYYSNTFSYEDRDQSEKRVVNLAKTRGNSFIDFVAKGTVDVTLLAGLRTKRGLADIVTGDPSLAWL